MYLAIKNENYGYAVATRDKWAAVGNPSFNLYPQVTASIPTSGSVDVYLYNKQTDTHALKETLYRHLWPEEEILLAAETTDFLHTEPTGSVPTTADLDLAIDWNNYLTASISDYGVSLDIHSNYLGVGYTRHSMSFSFPSASVVINFSGSGGVDIYDLSPLDPDPISIKQPLPQPTYYSYLSGYIIFKQIVPPKYSFVQFQTSTNLTNWYGIQTISVDYENGGTYYFKVPIGMIRLFVRSAEFIQTDPYLLSIKNPHPEITGSFGRSISINDDWIAIGSPHYSSSRGAVYMYLRQAESKFSNISWSFHSIITSSNAAVGEMFGWSLELNDAQGTIPYSTKSISYSQSLVVGTNKPSSSVVYYYEISGSNSGSLLGTSSIQAATWREEYRFSPTYPSSSLTFYPLAYPILSGSYSGSISIPDRFGHDVSIYGGVVAVGAPFDRYYYEYSASAVYQQGAFYIFERCPEPEKGFHLVLKSNGTEKSLKSHRMGYSLDTYDDELVVGCPKVTAAHSGGSTLTSCYVQGSLYQAHFCRTEDEYHIQGQICYLAKNTSSLEWEYKNVYQIKKRYLAPYRNFGFSVDMDDRFIIVGSPMNLNNEGRTVDIYYSGSNPDDFDPVAGQAYIYNLENYKEEFHVGNAFYRNGKLVIITSGSNFDGLFFNQLSDTDYEYDLKFANKQTLHEKQVICSVDPGEFNVSTNPTAIVVTSSIFDLNRNGRFDFQDLDVLMMYMNWKRTEEGSVGSTDWSSSILRSNDEISWYNYLKNSGSYYGTTELYSSSFALLNTTAMYYELDFNRDNILDENDQNIIWKYFSNRLDQKNFDRYITTNSSRRLFGDITDHLNTKTRRGESPLIKPGFFDYERSSKSDPTGSYLTPYATAIGLYQNGDLVAIAKLGSPIKLLPDYPYNFVVKMDF